MLEILLLMGLTRKIGSICQEKNRKAGPFKVMTVILWVLGEFMGAFIAAASGMEGFGVYGIAILGAAAGAAISFGIVSSLSPGQPDRTQPEVHAVQQNAAAAGAQNGKNAKVILTVKDPGFLVGAASAEIEFLVDGIRKGLVKFKETKEFEIPAGEHAAKLLLHGLADRMSKEIKFSAGEKETVRIEGKYSRAWGNMGLKVV